MPFEVKIYKKGEPILNIGGEVSDGSVFSQTFDELDIPAVIAFLNAKKRKPRKDKGQTKLI